MVDIIEAAEKDIFELSQIYVECLPYEPRALLGQKVCAEYFRAIIRHPSYTVFKATHESNCIGFSVILLKNSGKISKRWLLKFWPRILLMMFIKPMTVFPMVMQFFRSAIKKRTSSSQPAANQAPQKTSQKTAIFEYNAVIKDFRKHGIGRQLHQAGIKWAKDHHISRIEASVDKVNPQSQKIILKMGLTKFAETKIEYKYMQEL